MLLVLLQQAQQYVYGDIPPVVEIDNTGQGNWYKTKPKFRIKLVQKLTKELEEVRGKKVAEKENKEKQVELFIYEKLLYDQLVEEFDGLSKSIVNQIEYNKTEKILSEIKKELEIKKKTLQLEEEEIMFAFMSLM